jgi:hypothetical protein
MVACAVQVVKAARGPRVMAGSAVRRVALKEEPRLAILLLEDPKVAVLDLEAPEALPVDRRALVLAGVGGGGRVARAAVCLEIQRRASNAWMLTPMAAFPRRSM